MKQYCYHSCRVPISILRHHYGEAVYPVQHTENIHCPKCGSLQKANVLHTQPFYSYAHECSCGYWITESEWEYVQ